MARLFTLFLILFGLPAHAFSGVFVSEIAWMGTETSASNEWIELGNDTTESVLLNGWTLKAKDGSPSIALSGTILPGAYFLIERTDDDSVPNIPADLVTSFGKGLSNEGETLDLRDASNTIVDTVKGETNWKSIGGDAKTKLTAQKRGDTWVTAKATPKGAPPVPPPVAPKKTEVASPSPAPLPPKKESVPSSLVEEAPKPTLQKVYEDHPLENKTESASRTTLPLLGTLLLLGSGGVVYLRTKAKTEAEEYTITEEEADEEG